MSENLFVNLFEDLTPPRKVEVIEPEKAGFKITASTLSELNLDTELLAQYKTTVMLQESAASNDEIPLNQKAQIANTITAILKQIVDTQAKLYDTERLKLLENTLIVTLQEFPEISESFLNNYKKALNGL